MYLTPRWESPFGFFLNASSTEKKGYGRAPTRWWKRLKLTSLTALFKGLDVPNKVPEHWGRTLSSIQEQLWQDGLAAAPVTRMGTSGSWTQVHWAQVPSPLPLSHGCWFTWWWKGFDNMCICLDTVPQCERRTDGQKCKNSIVLCNLYMLCMQMHDKSQIDLKDAVINKVHLRNVNFLLIHCCLSAFLLPRQNTE